MTHNFLDGLVKSGTIRGYAFDTINGDTNKPGKPSPRGCNYERLVIEFNDGRKLKIDTSCSGTLENAHMFFEVGV